MLFSTIGRLGVPTCVQCNRVPNRGAGGWNERLIGLYAARCTRETAFSNLAPQ